MEWRLNKNDNNNNNINEGKEERKSAQKENKSVKGVTEVSRILSVKHGMETITAKGGDNVGGGGEERRRKEGVIDKQSKTEKAQERERQQRHPSNTHRQVFAINDPKQSANAMEGIKGPI